jgi:hypothetical protein
MSDEMTVASDAPEPGGIRKIAVPGRTAAGPLPGAAAISKMSLQMVIRRVIAQLAGKDTYELN